MDYEAMADNVVALIPPELMDGLDHKIVGLVRQAAKLGAMEAVETLAKQ